MLSEGIKTLTPTTGSFRSCEVTVPRIMAFWASTGAAAAALRRSAPNPVMAIRRNEKPVMLGILEEVGLAIDYNRIET